MFIILPTLKQVLCKKLELDGDSISTTSKEEIQELIDELSENVDALKSEIDEATKPLKSSTSSSSAAVTTIGFGGNSSSSSTAVTSCAVAINSTNVKGVEVVTLQVMLDLTLLPHS
jgi:vacuolar-type H+-ATPase subunit D/Vma8